MSDDEKAGYVSLCSRKDCYASVAPGSDLCGPHEEEDYHREQLRRATICELMIRASGDSFESSDVVEAFERGRIDQEDISTIMMFAAGDALRKIMGAVDRIGSEL